MAEFFNITGRGAIKVAGFDVRKNFALDVGTACDPSIVIRSSGWSQFCFNVERSEAAFVRLADGIDLARFPFCYLAQFEKAEALVVMSFGELLELATQIPDPKNLVHFFNTGHCGSTLLHHVFNRVRGTWCISEPMYFNQLAMERHVLGADAAAKLAQAGLRFLSLFVGAATAQTLVVKHFSQSTTQMKLLFEAIPESRCLFLYRDAKGWTNSVYHFVQKVGGTMVLAPDRRAFTWWIMSGNSPQSELDGLIDLAADVVTFDEMAAVAWALHMRQYREALVDGLPMMTVRYNELVADREATVQRVLDHCGIACDDVSATLDAFEADAQEGTRTARSIAVESFSSENHARVRAILSNPRVALDADVILPDFQR